MENGVIGNGSAGADHPRPRALGTTAAVLLAEGAIADTIDVASLPSELRASGTAERIREPGSISQRVTRLAERAAAGERVSMVSSSEELAGARHALSKFAAQRLSSVFHVVEPVPIESALALADLGWGVLFASDAEESFDLSFVARRASEDAGTPILVVHEPHAHVEPLAPVGAAFVEAFLGGGRPKRIADPGHPVHAQVGPRAFAERLPFALGSAFRELESFSGRRRDLVVRGDEAPVRRSPDLGDAQVVLVALGPLGDVALGEAARLRAADLDVGAVKVTSFRPFPGPRLVRILARAAAITVLETTDEPLAQSAPLTRELKSAFADALTWAPEYPGVGRIPRIHTALVRQGAHGTAARDVEAVVHNMLAGDHAPRVFALSGEGVLPTRIAPRSSAPKSSAIHVRALVGDGALADKAGEVIAESLWRLLALHPRARCRESPESEGRTHGFDLALGTAGAPSGARLPDELSVIVLSDPSAFLRGNPLARLAPSGTVILATDARTAEGVWNALPPYAKAIVHDRAARVFGYPVPSPDGEAVAGAIAGALCATVGSSSGPAPAAARVDPSLVAREVADVVGLVFGAARETTERAGGAARRAFEGGIEVPRAVVIGDEEGVRLGRKDARGAAAEA